MRYKAVLFDLDGTLLDYKTAQRNATNNSTELFNLVNSPEVQGFESRGFPAPGSPEMQQAFNREAVKQDPETFLAAYFQKLSQQGILIPGAGQILKSLEHTAKLAVVSNGPGSVQNPRLAIAGIAHYFPCRFFSRDLGTAKPDPAILNLAMEKLGVTIQETLFIGDSTTSDLPAARAAGIDFFLFKGNFSDTKLLNILSLVPPL